MQFGEWSKTNYTSGTEPLKILLNLLRFEKIRLIYFYASACNYFNCMAAV